MPHLTDKCERLLVVSALFYSSPLFSSSCFEVFVYLRTFDRHRPQLALTQDLKIPVDHGSKPFSRLFVEMIARPLVLPLEK